MCWKSDELVSICMSAGNTTLLVTNHHCYSKGFVMCILDFKGKKHQWWKWLKYSCLHCSPTPNVPTWRNSSTFNCPGPSHLCDQTAWLQATSWATLTSGVWQCFQREEELGEVTCKSPERKMDLNPQPYHVSFLGQHDMRPVKSVLKYYKKNY